MADGTIAIDEGVADKLVDTEQITVGANTVQRERIRVSGILAAELAAVLNADPASTVYGLIVRDVRGSATATPTFTDPIDRALRDMGKIDIAGFDVPLPIGTNNIGDVDVVGGLVAHDGVDSGNPVKVGARAQGSQIAAVADADRSDLLTDRHGNLRGRDGVQAPATSVFTNVNFPAVNTRASSTRAAGAAGVRHFLTGLTAVLAGGTTAPAAVQLDVRVRDGILDTGTILWQAVITLPATAGAMNGIARSGLWIPGTAATAITIEFSAAGGANVFESVSMELVDITE